jgi:transposase
MAAVGMRLSVGRTDYWGVRRRIFQLILPAAAQRFGFSTVTVGRWMEAGRLEGVKRSERWI